MLLTESVLVGLSEDRDDVALAEFEQVRVIVRVLKVVRATGQPTCERVEVAIDLPIAPRRGVSGTPKKPKNNKQHAQWQNVTRHTHHHVAML